MHQSILIYKRFLFLKLALLGIVAAVLPYTIHAPLQAPNGGTWLGYTLGCLGAFLIVWLMWFGIRKRRYGPGKVNLEAWLSAHVYFGLVLIIVATLHTGFQFGINVHTLAYALMMVVILSGFFGVYSYMRHPREMTENRGGSTLDQIMLELTDLDRRCREIAINLGKEMNDAVLEASRNTTIGGGLIRQLSGDDRACPTSAALDRVQALAASVSGEEAGHVRRLVPLLSRQCELLSQARKDIRFQALMRVWLFVHVPFSFALLAALIAHVFAVFFYW